MLDGTVLEPHPVAEGHSQSEYILEIVRQPNANVVFGENWHSDFSFFGKSASYSVLRGVVMPCLGKNDTLFSNTADAFDALSPQMQNILLDLQAYHSANKAYGEHHAGNSLAAMNDTSGSMRRVKEGKPKVLENDVLQPVVIVHPRTGRKSLFVSPTFTTHIKDMNVDESKALLKFLCDHIAKARFCTRVSWSPNQITMWDNRTLVHKVLADDTSTCRKIHRCTVRGTAPVNHKGKSFSLTHTEPAAKGGLFEDVGLNGHNR